MTMGSKTPKHDLPPLHNAVAVYSLDRPDLQATWQEDSTTRAWHSSNASFALWLNAMCNGTLPDDFDAWCAMYGLEQGQPSPVALDAITPAAAIAPSGDTTPTDPAPADDADAPRDA